jgi:hypothetical protein
MDMAVLISAIKNHRVRITDHADEAASDDHLTYQELRFSVVNGAIIEDYPYDTPYPSCLILGRNFLGEPIHSVWAYNSESTWAVLITVYRPDPELWKGWKVRVKK